MIVHLPFKIPQSEREFVPLLNDNGWGRFCVSHRKQCLLSIVLKSFSTHLMLTNQISWNVLSLKAFWLSDKLTLHSPGVLCTELLSVLKMAVHHTWLPILIYMYYEEVSVLRVRSINRTKKQTDWLLTHEDSMTTYLW